MAFRASQKSIKVLKYKSIKVYKYKSIKGLNQLRNFVLLQNAKIAKKCQKIAKKMPKNCKKMPKKTIVLSEFHYLALSTKKI